MDVVVQIRKVDSSGTPPVGINFPCSFSEDEISNAKTCKLFGPQGFLRASSAVSRDDDDPRSSRDGQEVFYRHDAEEKITPGTIISLEITLWPMGMDFAKDEGIMVRVGGHFLSEPSSEVMRPTSVEVESENENMGSHYVHTGGKYDSCTVLPVVATGRA